MRRSCDVYNMLSRSWSSLIDFLNFFRFVSVWSWSVSFEFQVTVIRGIKLCVQYLGVSLFTVGLTRNRGFEWRVVLLAGLGCDLGGQRERAGAGAELWTILCIAHRPAMARLWERRGRLDDSAGPRSLIALAWTLSSLERESPEEPDQIGLRYSILERTWEV